MESRDERLPAAHLERLEASRRALLSAIGETDDLTFLRGVGNLGDQLIGAGTRRLLAGHRYRELALTEVGTAGGETAVLSGGGAWCRPYHELMPRALRLAEERFGRVIVLPSSFDPAVPEVRAALERSARRGTTFFAREAVSQAAIHELCAAGIAHDAAFFADFASYRPAGSARRPGLAGDGTLLAYRTDREARGGEPPAGNRDISVSCSSLDEWLWTIARHAEVETDRAHVMIAAALLGKRVRFRPSSYHKVPAIAAWALADFDVRELPEPGRSLRLAVVRSPPEIAGPQVDEADEEPETPVPAANGGGLGGLRRRLRAQGERSLAALGLAAGGVPRVTVVVLSRDRGELAARCIASLAESVSIPYQLLVVDNGSRPEDGALLAAAVAAHGCALGAVDLLRLERNAGCAGGRQLAVERASTPYVMFLDDDAEVFPGTVEHLVVDLEAHSAALAVGAKLVLPSGLVQLCGGDWEERDGVLHFAPLSSGLPFDDPAVGASGACRWLAGAAVLFRREALLAAPFDAAIGYYEDNEWFYRLRHGAPDRSRRAVDALALHHQAVKARGDLFDALPFLESIARFYSRHAQVLDGLFTFVPELTTADGRCDAAAGRLFLELLLARGSDWLLFEWMNGSFAPLFAGGRHGAMATELAAAREESAALADARARSAAELAALHGSRLWRLADGYWSARRMVRRWLGSPPAAPEGA